MGAQSSWPLEVRAIGTDIPDEIFVWQIGQGPSTNSGDPESGDRFSCVASLPQMHEIPRTTGRTLSSEWGIPYYRSNFMRVICRNPAEVEDVWAVVQQHAQALVENWNASWVLKGSSQVTINEDTINPEPFVNPPTLLYLEYRPAGNATLNGDVPGIEDPDPSLPGWLPVSLANPSWIVPPGAVFFYNLEKDDNLKSRWPLSEPFSGHQLHRNGLLLPHGITHVIDEHAIWWLEFSPSNLPGYAHIDGQEDDGASPWPVDYVNASNPGSVSPRITLQIFE